MKKLIIVSNRLPVSVSRKKGKLQFIPSVGGLATGLGSIYRRFESIWVGWPGVNLEDIDLSERELIEEKLKESSCIPIFLTSHEVGAYYYGFCNKTIWPLFHYFYLYMDYTHDYFEEYKRVNRKFCEKILEIAGEEDFIWIHDYHLMLLPAMLKKNLPDATIGFFLHIPFPSYEVYRLLPPRSEILEGLLGADLIGFHTYDYALHFISSVMYLLGYEHAFGEITVRDRIVKVDAFPMGIDYAKFANALDNPRIARDFERLKRRLGDVKVILSVDRLDYTKGIPQRLEAFDLFLERYPEYIEKVTMILVGVPTRTGVEHYMMLKKQVDELVGKINGKYGTVGWNPVWYLYRSLPFHNLSVLYHIADVALVTPLRDGMNLIAKEYIASKDRIKKGVLVLSEFAGAAKELGEAILVNPNDVGELCDSLREALDMSEEEQIERNVLMQSRLRRYTVSRWANDFMDSMNEMKELRSNYAHKKVDKRVVSALSKRFKNSSLRVLFLDYDGTLVPFASRPEKALPDNELKNLLAVLSSLGEIVLISGRDRNTLEKWFGDLEIALVAEHGVWGKMGGEWFMLEALDDKWKEQVRPILELFVDRTPGTFIEEKEYSLAWHYRMADPDLAAKRARELKNTLLQLVANLNLGVMEGNKVIEVKDARINKGRAVSFWLSQKSWDFVFAAGDDVTDEDMFSVLPDEAISIKVGLGHTKAKYIVESYKEVRKLLKAFTGGDGERD